MRKSWFEYGKITSKDLYDKLNTTEKKRIETFRDYMLISASEGRTEESIREVLRFKYIIQKNIDKIDLEDLRYFLKELKQSSFSDHTKNKIKGFIQKFLKWAFKDWSKRFNEFEDIRLNTDAQNKKRIDKKSLLSKEDIEKLIEAEPSLFWKTFLITQSEGGLRTKEVRELKWKNVEFEDDGFTTLKIPSKKNRNGTVKINPVVVKVAGNFLKELREQQRKNDIDSEYVFHSPQNTNKPISKSVNLWFNNLCKKVLGRPANNYLLRHSKGTQLQEKVRKGEVSKDNAVTFMRHSEKMFDKAYSHMTQEDIKQLIKEQIYNNKELTQVENDRIKELENQVNKLKNDRKKFKEEMEEMYQAIVETQKILQKDIKRHNIKRRKK